MANTLGLGVFGTFGQPEGFQQAFSADCNFVHSLDLDSEEIELFPNTELFAVKKEVVKGVYAVSFSIYTFVREMNVNRNVTFLGSCIVLQGVYIDAEKIYKLVRELQTDLIGNLQNVSNNTIQVRKVVNLAVKEPAQFQPAQLSAASIEDTPFYSPKIDSGKKYFVKTGHIESTSQIISFFDEALKNFNDTESLYFTFSDKIINAVSKKRKLNVIDWDQFINYKNHIKQDFITTKHGLKHTPPDIAPIPVVEDKPTEQIEVEDKPVEQPFSANETMVNTNPPTAQDEDVIHGPDFPFDGWAEPTRGWAIEEATKKAHEYNRLLAYAKHLKLHNDNLSGHKQNDIAHSADEQEETARPQQKQPSWGEIPINNTSAREDGDDENNNTPFYKKRLFVFILVGALLVFTTGGYMVYKKHVLKRQAQATEGTTNTSNSVNTVIKPVDTTRPAEHPPVTDTTGQK